MTEPTLPDAVPLKGVVVDIETTGIPPSKRTGKWPGVVQFGAARALSGGGVEVFFERCRVRPEAVIDPAALWCSGASKEGCLAPGLPTEEEGMLRFLRFCRRSRRRTLYGLALEAFDCRFLLRILGLANEGRSVQRAYPFTRLVDIQKHSIQILENLRKTSVDRRELEIMLNRRCLLQRGNGTEWLVPAIHRAERIHNIVGLPNEWYPHRADVGALLKYESFHRYTHGRGALERYAGDSIPDYLRRVQSRALGRSPR